LPIIDVTNEYPRDGGTGHLKLLRRKLSTGTMLPKIHNLNISMMRAQTHHLMLRSRGNDQIVTPAKKFHRGHVIS
jgi:hypothetical protein